MKILLRSPFDTMSGYGADGCGMVTALLVAGHDVHLWPENVTPPIPSDVAELLQRYPDPPFDLGIAHLNPGSKTSRPIRAVCERLVLWTMWEYEQYRWPGWEDARGELASSEYDHLFCYDDVTLHAIGEDPLVNPGIPASVLQGGYTPDYWAEVQPRKRDWTGTFRYVMVGRLDPRKNPWAAVRAFGRLKDEHGDAFDAELHLKTTVARFLPPQLGKRWPGIKVHLEWWSHERLRNLYAQSHCYLAPSTGEGKNVPALEAQTTGIPVIGTNYGGHTGWMSSDWAYPLGYTLVDVGDRGTGAQVDEDQLREAMWHVYTHREEARQKGELAARTIPPMMGWSSVVDRLMAAVNRIEPKEHDVQNVKVTT